MGKRSIVLIAAVLFIMLFSQQSASAKDQPYTAQIRPGFMAGSGQNVSDFYLDLFVPLQGDDKGLFFLNPNIRFDDHSGNEQNFGVGYRRLVLDDQMILGANLFYDHMRSQNNFDYSQLGIGVEMLTKWIDARANYYYPLSSRRHKLSNSDSYEFGSSAILQTSSWEEAELGFDFEIGVLVPFVSDLIETRAYVGGYQFDSKLQEDIAGKKYRVEVRPAKILNLSVEVKDDDINGTDTFMGGYLDIPFSVENLFRGKNPFEGIKDAMKFGNGARPLKERMVEKVVRDRNIPVYDVEKKEKYADMIYVNQDNPNYGSGTLKNPYHDIMSAESDARFREGTWVYVFSWDKNPDTYRNVSLQLKPNMVLWGQGYRNPRLGLGGGIGNPILEGVFRDTLMLQGIVNLADQNEVMGLTFTNGDTGILGENVKNISIHHNSFQNLEAGILIRNDYFSAVSNSTLTYQYAHNDFFQVVNGIVSDMFLVGKGSVQNLQIINRFEDNLFVDAISSISNYCRIDIYDLGGSLSGSSIRNVFSGNIIRNGLLSGITSSSSFQANGTVKDLRISNRFENNLFDETYVSISNSSAIGAYGEGSSLSGSSIGNVFSGNTIMNKTAFQSQNGIENINVIQTIGSAAPISGSSISNLFENNRLLFETPQNTPFPTAISNIYIVSTSGDDSNIIGSTVQTDYRNNEIRTVEGDWNIHNVGVMDTYHSDINDSRIEYRYVDNISDCKNCAWNIAHDDYFGYQSFFTSGSVTGNSGLFYSFRDNVISSDITYFRPLEITAYTYNAPVNLMMERNKVTTESLVAVKVTHSEFMQGLLTADLGGGALSSIGHNSFKGMVLVDSSTNTSLAAENNWWNNGAINPFPDQTNIPVSTWLDHDPLP